VTYQDPQVIAEAERFVPVKINVAEDRKRAEEYHIEVIPVIILKGTSKQTVRLEGFQSPEELLREMKAVK
jgi:hypothetical protein